jgi:hypothetical protein
MAGGVMVNVEIGDLGDAMRAALIKQAIDHVDEFVKTIDLKSEIERQVKEQVDGMISEEVSSRLSPDLREQIKGLIESVIGMHKATDPAP